MAHEPTSARDAASSLLGRFQMRPGLGTELKDRWADGALRHLVDDPSEFASRSWGRGTHVSRTTGTLCGLIDLSDVAGIVAQRGMRAPDIRLMRDGEPIDATAFLGTAQLGRAEVHDLVRPHAIADLLRTGATLILQGARRYCAPLDAFCRSLDSELRQVTQAGVFLTPPHARGAPHHYDFYDAFLYQLEGAKCWRIGEAPERAPREPWRPGCGVPHSEAQLLRTEPGDCIYLPRGTYHSGETHGRHSLHMTIRVVQPYTYRTLINAAMDEWFPNVDLDSALPIGYPAEHLTIAAELGQALTLDRIRDALVEGFKAIHRDFDTEVGDAGESGTEAIIDAVVH